jgi:hypothetical protein
MNKKVTVAVLLALALALTMAAVAQEPGKKPEGGAPQMTPEMKAAMEAMMRAATPGENHKLMETMAGTFKAVVKTFHGPGAPPEVSEGLSVNTMVLGGRYLRQEFKGEFMGETFEGVGFMGYDNVLKKFQGVWMDSMSTAMMNGTSALDKTGKVLNGATTYTDPATGKVKTTRDVMTLVDKDRHVSQMYEKGPDGKEFLMMEITYTRVK